MDSTKKSELPLQQQEQRGSDDTTKSTGRSLAIVRTGPLMAHTLISPSSHRSIATASKGRWLFKIVVFESHLF